MGLNQHDLPAYWQGVVHNPQKDLGLPYEDVEFPSWGAQMLRGWYIPAAPPSNPVALCLVHGGGQDRRAWLRHCGFFSREGYSCLLFDFSGHGNSDGAGRGFSYGVKENIDVSAAVRYLKTVKGFEKVVVIGTSVGGAAGIIAAANDTNIDGVIAENPVSNAYEFALEHLKKMLAIYGVPRAVSGILLQPFYKLVSSIFLIRIGSFPFVYRSPADLISQISPRPVLLMHGTNDDIVSYEHSQVLFNRAQEPKHLWLAAEAWHCALYDKYPNDFKSQFRTFMSSHFGITRTADEATQQPEVELTPPSSLEDVRPSLDPSIESLDKEGEEEWQHDTANKLRHRLHEIRPLDSFGDQTSTL
jgi:pimeloyl-ACP methyl ester carboxylesterase